MPEPGAAVLLCAAYGMLALQRRNFWQDVRVTNFSPLCSLCDLCELCGLSIPSAHDTSHSRAVVTVPQSAFSAF
jgi:hypothetical protein